MLTRALSSSLPRLLVISALALLAGCASTGVVPTPEAGLTSNPSEGIAVRIADIIVSIYRIECPTLIEN